MKSALAGACFVVGIFSGCLSILCFAFAVFYPEWDIPSAGGFLLATFLIAPFSVLSIIAGIQLWHSGKK